MSDRPPRALEPRRRTDPARRPSVALALGGGGARGLAHIAVLEVLDELKIVPKAIAGTSIGALYGAGYAAGYSAAQIKALTLETLGTRFDIFRQLFAARSQPVQKLFNLLPLRSALLDAPAVIDLVLPSRMPTDFSELKIPLAVVATDLETREPVIFSKGPLKPAIASSIAIPVIFSPVDYDGRQLVDGGLVNPLPYDLLKGAADIVVAIDVSGGAGPPKTVERPSAIDVFVTAVQILEKSVTRERLRHQPPDIYVDVDLDRFNAFDFFKPREILEATEPIKANFRRQLERVLAAETAYEVVVATERAAP